MSEVAKKLEEYRKNKLKNKTQEEKEKELTENLIKDIDSDIVSSSEETEEVVDDTIQCCSLVQFLYYALCFAFWIILYAIFIKLQFGTVFFLVSCLVAMYMNTRTRPKKKGEVSAYSVFNKDCKSIDGTLKAEQFEREIRYGPNVVR
ncbi:uncharacterized protein LOC126887234 [Diabrotica virgifera virgifera]|uniref:Uncharacterized protein LOC114341881 n=1 Tax=Diabrotica virgifera virgifera TaxID=50390 RepID=A0A6P7GFQ8_DIAVI|nr:uncharacterized protein LOC126887234 [Diabrotica virgifera virgifera]